MSRTHQLFAVLFAFAGLIYAALHFGFKDPAPIESVPPPRGPVQCGAMYERICSDTGFDLDPTGVVLSDREAELEVKELIADIVSEHEDWEQEQLDEELVARIFIPARVERLDQIYLWVIRAMEKFIEAQSDSVLTLAEKRLLKRRIRKTPLEMPPPASRYADAPQLLTKTDVFYERFADGRTRLRVGGGYVLGTQSRYNLTFTIAHELAHSIDPCELRARRIAIPAYDRLSACFVQTGLVATRKTRLECGHDDQLAEAFADWFAAQVTTEALMQSSSGYSNDQLFHSVANSVRDLCEVSGAQLDDEFHPAAKLRIERIFGDHPQMRKLLHCQEPPVAPRYCGFN